jgi:hypothetical protein
LNIHAYFACFGLGITIKKPVKEIKASRPVCEVVEEKLRLDPDNGYTIMGLMIEGYDVMEAEINGKPSANGEGGFQVSTPASDSASSV